jgi:ribosomal protein S27E
VPAVPRPVVFFQGKEEKIMRVKCISCGNELNLDHWVFEDYSGPVKCFSCSTMMEVKTNGGAVYSINPLAAYESNRSSVSRTEERLLKSISA